MHYVYVLKNSLTDLVFYGGKGQGMRMYDHEIESRSLRNNCKRHQYIRDLWEQGGHVIPEKVAEFQWEQDSFIYEWVLINLIYGRENLANETDGGGMIAFHSSNLHRLNLPEWEMQKLRDEQKRRDEDYYRGKSVPGEPVSYPFKLSPYEKQLKIWRNFFHALDIHSMKDYRDWYQFHRGKKNQSETS